jgi:hypothetical protein
MEEDEEDGEEEDDEHMILKTFTHTIGQTNAKVQVTPQDDSATGKFEHPVKS